MKIPLLSSVATGQNQKFHDLFNEAAAYTVKMAELLHDATDADASHTQKMHFNQIASYKARSYEIKHEIYALSGRTFISPFERDDMYYLSSAINSVADYIDISARRINLYQLATISPFIRELTGLITDSCIELEKAVKGLQNLDDRDAIYKCCESIKQLEHYADKVYGKAVAELMTTETDTLEVIKNNDILASLERATDKCEHATTVIESILIKNS